MDPNAIPAQVKKKFQDSTYYYLEDIKKLRTGRAHPSMLDGIMVEAYGVKMPLIQVGSVTVPEAQMIQVAPFDPSNVQAVAAAIRDNQSLGLNPSDDGHVVRVSIPPLTTERRQEIVKQLNEKTEEAMISLRNSRHEAQKEIDSAKKDKKIGEDDAKRLQKRVDELMNEARDKIEAEQKAKQEEIMTV
jgi:ribosome recycling factor